MRQNISGKAGSYAARHKRRSHWRRLLMALACVVVFCTTYALILPAITLENPEALDAPVCGLEEHIHSESCFEARPEAQHKQFHCCDGSGNLVGISSDLVLHTHDEQCYDPDGTLVCPLPEITAHTHDASCYHASLVSQGHHHTEECISEWVQGELICALPTEAHVHGEGCYDGSGELICQISEQAHVHTDECYERLPVYSCNQEESEDVYGEQELTCQRREVFPHTHSTDCYDGSGNLTCGHLQVVSHQHTAECYDLVTVPAQTVQTCTIPEHTHTEACFPQNSEQASDILVGDSIPADLESDLASSDQESNGILTDQDSNAALFASGATGGGAEYTVDSVTIKYRENPWDSTWENLNDGATLKGGAELRFLMEFTLDARALSTEYDSVIYNVPFPLNAASGPACNRQGDPIGTYTISESGEIRITFDEETIQANQNSPIEGGVYFYSSVEKIHTGSGDQMEIPIGDDVYKITVVEDAKKTSDLKVEKTGSVGENGLITYTVKVTSEHGTSQAVEVHDVRTSSADRTEYVPGTVTITGPNGEAVNGNVSFSEDGQSFGFSLPQMAAGETYIITYQVKATDLANGNIWAGNKVKATSKDNNNKEIYDEQEIHETITVNTLKKEGTRNEDGSISWTVTVNERGLDISNWKLSDILNGEAYIRIVTITPGPNGEDSAEIKLPYTFPEGSNQKYTITYTTTSEEVELPMGQDKIKNKATLTTPDDGGTIDTETSVDGPDLPSYLTKKNNGYTLSEDGKTGIANWEVTIDSTRGPIEAPWVYTDDTGYGKTQWFTAAQLTEMKKSLDEALQAADLNDLIDKYTIKVKKSDDWEEISWDNVQEDDTFMFIQVTFNEDMPKGYSIVHKFQSTINIEGALGEKTFTNNVKIESHNHTVQGWDNITYTPKVGPTIEKSGDAQTNIFGKEDDPNWQGIGWKIKVTVPRDYAGGALTMVEHLPENTTLSKLEISERNYIHQTDISSDGSHTIQCWTWPDPFSVNVNVIKDNSDVKVVIPEDLAKLQVAWGNLEIYFNVYVKPTDGINWGTADDTGYWIPSADLTNSAELYHEDSKIDDSESTTKIIKDDEQHPLTKSGVRDGNFIKYTVDINPKGEQLNGGNPLTLEDVLTATRTSNNQVELVVGSMKVSQFVEEENENTPGETVIVEKLLDPSLYSYQYSVDTRETDSNNHYWENVHTIKMSLPDGMHLRVTYKYKAVGVEGTSATLKNTARLVSTKIDEASSSTDNTTIQITEDGAYGDVSSIGLTKVDADSYGTLLSGATFQLYEYNTETKNYDLFKYTNPKNPEEVISEWTTNDDGFVSLQGLKRNTPYKLVEIKAPEGYLNTGVAEYFYVYDSSAPDNVPKDFQGEKLFPGDDLTIENTSDKTQITVKKVWKDTDGTDLEQVPNSPITVQLYRKKTADGEGELCKSVEIGPGNSWTHTFTGLSKTWVDESGTRQNYLYYVEEEPYSGYETTYGNNGGINSSVNADGEVINPITITNTKSSSYALPNTGGPGAVMYMAGGLAIASVSLLLLYIEIKHRRKGNASF